MVGEGGLDVLQASFWTPRSLRDELAPSLGVGWSWREVYISHDGFPRSSESRDCCGNKPSGGIGEQIRAQVSFERIERRYYSVAASTSSGIARPVRHARLQGLKPGSTVGMRS
jgi:hypothetical protein